MLDAKALPQQGGLLFFGHCGLCAGATLSLVCAPCPPAANASSRFKAAPCEVLPFPKALFRCPLSANDRTSLGRGSVPGLSPLWAVSGVRLLDTQPGAHRWQRAILSDNLPKKPERAPRGR